jgi:hypothetical protein
MSIISVWHSILKNVSTDDLRQILAVVEGKTPTHRLMATITTSKMNTSPRKKPLSGTGTPVDGSHDGLIDSNGSLMTILDFHRQACRRITRRVHPCAFDVVLLTARFITNVTVVSSLRVEGTPTSVEVTVTGSPATVPSISWAVLR